MCLGIPGKIVDIVDESAHLVTVDVGGVRRTINVAFIAKKDLPVASLVGEWVLVHVGFAMIRIDEAEAAATLALLQEMGECENEGEGEVNAMRTSAA